MAQAETACDTRPDSTKGQESAATEVPRCSHCRMMLLEKGDRVVVPLLGDSLNFEVSVKELLIYRPAKGENDENCNP